MIESLPLFLGQILFQVDPNCYWWKAAFMVLLSKCFQYEWKVNGFRKLSFKLQGNIEDSVAV